MIGLLALLDDISLALKKVAVQADDIAILSKAATKSTAGLIGDDLALNAKEFQGLHNNDELKVIWRVFLGALLNKLIIIPVAMTLSVYLPLVFKCILIIGGGYLCVEGALKVREKLVEVFKKDDKNRPVLHEKQIDTTMKIKGAIRTDFILSIEIIAIILATFNNFSDVSLTSKLISLVLISTLITIFIYGVVAFIVKIDDMGIFLLKKGNPSFKSLAIFLINLSPKIMSFLGVAGTIAMFLVGGELIVHELHLPIYPFLEFLQYPLYGVVIGSIMMIVIGLLKKLKR